jgi:hypothetical protein
VGYSKLIGFEYAGWLAHGLAPAPSVRHLATLKRSQTIIAADLHQDSFHNLSHLIVDRKSMSPAPETVRRPLNSSSSPAIPISSILSRALRASSENYALSRRSIGSLREGASPRRNVSGGPRPAPFRRQSYSFNSIGANDRHSTERVHRDAMDEGLPQRDRVRTRSSNVTTLIAEEWRRQRDSLQAMTRFETTSRRRTPSPELTTESAWRNFSPPRVFIGEDSSESESDDDDDADNKFPNSMNELERTPSPTFLTPDTSPSRYSNASSSPADEDCSRNAYTLSCRFCANILTKRGMRARLVADARVHIWSTDEQPKYPLCWIIKANGSVKLVGQKYATTTCQCQLMYCPFHFTF